MGAPDPTLQKWQQFSQQMSRAGDQIESIFVTGLVGLTGPLGNLSSVIEKSLAGFLGNGNMTTWINDFAAGIETLATYLGSPKFQSDVVAVATDIGFLGDKLGSWMQALGLLPAGATTGAPLPLSTGVAGEVNPVRSHLPPALGGTYVQGGRFGNASAAGLPDAYYHGMSPFSANTHGGYNFSAIAAKYHMTPAAFYALAMQESSLRAHGPDSPTGAQGMFQQEPGFQSDFGVTDPYNPSQEANAEGMAMQKYMKKYKNLAMALAAINAGPGTVDEQIAAGKASGTNWFNVRGAHQSAANLRQEQGFVSQVGARLGLTVKVMNQTGSQVAILANATRQ
jgi:hypothetical protein